MPPRLAQVLAYTLGSGTIVALFIAAGLAFVAREDVPRDGPLASGRPTLEEPLPGTISLPEVLEACFPGRAPDAVAKIVGGLVRGAPYYACYRVSGDTDGSVDPVIVDRLGREVSDAGLIKEGGAWPSVGTVTSSRGVLVFGLAAIIALVLVWFLHALVTRDTVGDRRASGWRTTGLVLTWIVLGIGGLVAFVFMVSILLYPDAAGLAAVALVLATVVYGTLVQDVLAGRPLVSWLGLAPTKGSLALGLVVSALLIPVLVVLSVFLAGLGEVPPTGTLVTGLLGVATGVFGLAAVLVVIRWRVARTAMVQHVGAAWRRSLTLALLLAVWAGAAAVAVSVASAHAPSWQIGKIGGLDGGTRSGDSERAETDELPSAIERRAVELVAPASGRRVERAYCSGPGVCDIVFSDGTCQVWITVANDAAAVPALTCDETEAGPG